MSGYDQATIEVWQSREARWWRPAKWEVRVCVGGEIEPGLKSIGIVICHGPCGAQETWSSWTRERALAKGREVALRFVPRERANLTTEVFR